MLSRVEQHIVEDLANKAIEDVAELLCRISSTAPVFPNDLRSDVLNLSLVKLTAVVELYIEKQANAISGD